MLTCVVLSSLRLGNLLASETYFKTQSLHSLYGDIISWKHLSLPSRKCNFSFELGGAHLNSSTYVWSDSVLWHGLNIWMPWSGHRVRSLRPHVLTSHLLTLLMSFISIHYPFSVLLDNLTYVCAFSKLYFYSISSGLWCWLHLHLGDFANALIQNDLQPFIHTSTAESTTQGDSQLARSSHLDTQLEGDGDRTSNQTGYHSTRSPSWATAALCLFLSRVGQPYTYSMYYTPRCPFLRLYFLQGRP